MIVLFCSLFRKFLINKKKVYCFVVIPLGKITKYSEYIKMYISSSHMNSGSYYEFS